MPVTQHNLQALYEEYVYQRENGVPREDAVALVKQLSTDFDQQSVRQLIHMIQNWEHAYEPTQPMNVHEIEARALRSQPQGLPCPNCSTVNPVEAKFCYSCGQILGAASTIGKTTQLYEDLEDGAIFGRLSTLTLTIRGYEQHPIRTPVGEQPMLIGRNVAGSPAQAQIDLEPYRGQELGVSRIHAAVQRESQTLILVDKGSANHTYINGEMIHPHEKRVVRDGDELRLGRLVVRVNFQRELKRL